MTNDPRTTQIATPIVVIMAHVLKYIDLLSSPNQVMPNPNIARLIFLRFTVNGEYFATSAYKGQFFCAT